MKAKIRKSLNLILGALLGVLGFGCGSMPVAYGPPPQGDFTAKGRVVNEANEPLENIQIIVKRGHKDDAENLKLSLWDILYTNTEGDYYKYYPNEILHTYNRVIANDTTGVYASDSLDVNTRFSSTGDGHWDYGKSILTVDFVLKEKKE